MLLVRLGGHAAGVFRGRELVDSKVGSRLVHGRHRAGGSSSGRFARRRAGQARVALQAAAGRGGARCCASRPRRASSTRSSSAATARALDERAGGPRLAAVRALAATRVLDVPDPRLAVLEATPDQFLATIVRPR